MQQALIDTTAPDEGATTTTKGFDVHGTAVVFRLDRRTREVGRLGLRNARAALAEAAARAAERGGVAHEPTGPAVRAA